MLDTREKIKILTKHSYTMYFISTFVPMSVILVYLIINTAWSWISVLAFVLGYFLIYIYGINIFYHRYWSHKQIKPNQLVLKFFTLLGTLAMIGGPTSYAWAHRWHHAHSDTKNDPHSPLDGKWHAFIGWTFKLKPDSIPSFIIRDFFKKEYEWIFTVEKLKIIFPWTVVLVLFFINEQVCLGILLSMFATHFIELYINAFLHDTNTKSAIDVHPLIGFITAGGLTHKLHHENPGIVHTKDPGKFLITLVNKK